MSAVDPNGGGALVVGGGGSGLPAGGTASDTLTGDAAWTPSTTVLFGAMSALLGADPVGTPVIADGVGGATTSSAAVAALLASADAAAMRTAAGVAYGSRIDAPLDTGGGWAIVAPTGGNAGTSAATLPGAGVGRLTMGTTGDTYDLVGPRIERALTWRPGARWRFRATLAAAVNASGAVIAGIYLRSAAAVRLVLFAVPGALLNTGSWASGLGSNTGGIAAADGTCTLEIQVSELGSMSLGAVATSGLYTQHSSVSLPFVPTHFGLFGAASGASVGSVDFTGLVAESFG